ncbi:hypothetical protein NQ176_g5452 [Zarea fungicola]|uniref:Uncharacterized protein n=1 Tax=Zarea fungicola TaxID=93591 RepID=A0ACC1N8I5_9HYPO|nr:hypothetical protein NQ176_g5452 [Lecanicillium fungicola]
MPGFRDSLPWRRRKHAERSVPASTQPSLDSQTSATRPTLQTPIDLRPTTQPPETVTPTNTANENISETLWSQAYQKLEENEPELLEGYKKHLGDILHDTDVSQSNPATIATLVQQLQKDREGKQWKLSFRGKEHKIRDQVEKLAKLFVFCDAVIKQAVSAQPYAALAWSGVSVFLPLLSETFKKDEAMVKGFTTISDIQLYWRTCEETFLVSSAAEHYQDLIAPLATVYSHILEYQIRAICHLASKQSSRAWQNVAGWGEWADKASSIVKASEDCKAYFEPLQQREARTNFTSQLQRLDKLCSTQQEFLQVMKENLQEDKYVEFLQALASAAPTYEADKNINLKQVEGTCEWFFNDEGFCDWRDRPNSGLFWISAGPGCGKSVLSRALIDGGHLSSDVSTISIPALDTIIDTTTICYFFFKEGDSRRTRIANALCAVLHQLFSNDATGELIQHGISAYKSNGEVLLEKVTDLWKILIGCAESWPADIICVLDALDECDNNDYKTLSHLFSDYYSENPSRGKLKFFITSRPYDIIESLFRPMSNRAQFVRFDGDERYEDISRDIDLVIDARINDFAPDFKLEDKMKIAEHLKSRGTRTYLWLHLTLSIIEEKPSRYRRRVDIEALLSEIPSQVSEAYEKILQRSEDERMTITLLQILLTAERDLTVSEANYALTMALAETPFHTHADIASQCWQGDFKMTVKNLCGLIVNIYGNRLSFIHLTAREFLISKREADMKWEWKGRFQLTPELGQILTQCCMTYLLLDDWLRGAAEQIVPDSSEEIYPDSLEEIYPDSEEEIYPDSEEEIYPDSPERLPAFPFLRYSTQYWPDHLKALGSTASDYIKQQARLVLAAASPYNRVWLRCLPTLERFSGWTDLAVASHLGLYTIVEDMLSAENVEVNAWSAGVGTALEAAVESSQVELVDLLISRGADVNLTKGFYSPLSRAIQDQNVELVNLLLLHGAYARVPGTYSGEFPLQTAVDAGNKHIFLTVLGKYFDVNTVEGIETAVVGNNLLRAGAQNSKYLRMLLDVFGPDMHLTQHMLELLMSVAEDTWEYSPDKESVASRALQMALDRRDCDFRIKASMLENVLKGTANIELLHRLLSRKEEFQFLVTEEVIQTIAEFGNATTMKLFLEHFDVGDGISGDTLLRAASNRIGNKQSAMMHLLLDCWEGTIENGERILVEAISLGDEDMVKRLLNHPGFHFHVLFGLMPRMERAHGGLAWEGLSKTIVDRTGLEVLGEDYVLGEVARYSTGVMLRLVLDRLGHGYVPSEHVLSRAAEAVDGTPDNLKMLLEWHGSHIQLTAGVFVAAARSGLEVLDWLLETRSQEVHVTEELIEALAEDNSSRSRKTGSLKTLLCLKRDDVIRLAPFAMLAAARHHNTELLEFLADEGLITADMFTEEVLLAMLEGGNLDKEAMEYFKTKLLEQTTIGAKLMERIAMHKYSVELLAVIRRKRPGCFFITEGMIEAAATNGQEETLHYLYKWEAAEAGGSKEHRASVVADDRWYVAAQFRSAAVKGDVRGMRRALYKGADPNLPDSDGVTPINAAAASSKGEDSVLFLTKRRDVDVNAADKHGTTPLHNAIQGSGEESVRALLSAGADPDKADSKGVTPYMRAMRLEKRLPEIAGLFRISSTRLCFKRFESQQWQVEQLR